MNDHGIYEIQHINPKTYHRNSKFATQSLSKYPLCFVDFSPFPSSRTVDPLMSVRGNERVGWLTLLGPETPLLGLKRTD